MDKKLELLAPAGSYESLKAAVNAGADAVYIGGMRFGARAYADNLDQEKMIEAIDYCHLHGRKLYMTVNTLLKQAEFSELYDYLNPFYEHGLDAVIVQDVGALAMIRQCFPELEIHASTQMTLTGPDGCRFLKEQGVKRVVTSRELSLKEIRGIKEAADMEIESFVHGALCYCYSGQCLMSSLIGGRSGNRGRCAQPCRLQYQFEGGEKKYFLSPKDICTLQLIPAMAEAGVFSFKIEGRMKRPEYTAGVVEIYRKYIDLYLNNGARDYKVLEKDRIQLMDLYNRGGFSEGYYETRNGREMMSLDQPNHFGTPAAKVVRLQKGKAMLTALEDLNKNDTLITPEIKLDSEHPKSEKFTIPVKNVQELRAGQILRRVRNDALLRRLDEKYLRAELKEKINGKLMISKKFPAILELNAGDICVRARGSIAMEAKSQPLTAEKVKRQTEKTGDSPFIFEKLDIELEDGCFLPIQDLNALRRDGMELLEKELLQPFARETGKRPDIQEEKSSQCYIKDNPEGESPELMISLRSCEALDELLDIPEITGFYVETIDERVLSWCREAKKSCYLTLPRIFRQDTQRRWESEGLAEKLDCFDGVLISAFEEYGWLTLGGYGKDMILDHNMYTFNRGARRFWREKGICRDTAPVELNARELAMRGCEGSEILVYGRLPVMVSAQCLLKTNGRCDKQQGGRKSYRLTDRMGKTFPVSAECRYCHNIIYNSTPLVLLDYAGEIKGLHPRSIRLSFTFEDRQETVLIVKEYIKAFYHGQKAHNPFQDFTKGHFKRGVE